MTGAGPSIAAAAASVAKEGRQFDEAIATALRAAIVDEPPPLGSGRPVDPVSRQVDSVCHGLGLGALPRPRSYGLAAQQTIDILFAEH